MPDQLMQIVEVATCALDTFECFGHLPDSGNGAVVGVVGSAVFGIGPIELFGHDACMATDAAPQTEGYRVGWSDERGDWSTQR